MNEHDEHDDDHYASDFPPPCAHAGTYCDACRRRYKQEIAHSQALPELRRIQSQRPGPASLRPFSPEVYDLDETYARYLLAEKRSAELDDPMMGFETNWDRWARRQDS